MACHGTIKWRRILCLTRQYFLVITDETKKLVTTIYKKKLFSKKYYQDTAAAYAPVNLVPPEMENVAVCSLSAGLPRTLNALHVVKQVFQEKNIKIEA